MITVEEAFDRIGERIRPLGAERVDLQDAAGRVLAADLHSDVDSPPHDKSVMDGFAVRAADLQKNRGPFPVSETIVAGGVPKRPLSPGQVARIMTGAPLPEGADAVVMVEQAHLSDDALEVRFDVAAVAPGKHIMRRAASMARGDRVFSAGQRLTAWHIGLLAETGHGQVEVGRIPRVAVLPTGDELVSCSSVPGPGQIRNSNGPMLIAMARQRRLDVTDLGVGRDDEDDLRGKIEAGLEKDLLILSGGVSAGMLDLVPRILAEQGVEQVFHKVLVKPGKPIWFGFRDREGESPTWVFGLPGNPVSSLVGFQLFVCSAIERMEGLPGGLPALRPARLTRGHETRGNRPTYWPGRREMDESPECRVAPLPWQGSSDLKALGEADCLIHFPVREEPYRTGETVQFFELR